MIARLWHGWTSRENAGAYETLLRNKVLPGIHRVSGYGGAYLLKRAVPEGVEFVTITFFESLNAASEAEQFAQRTASRSRSEGDESGWRARTTPPAGSIGYTGSYREPSADVVEVSVVSVLEARGPD